MELTPSHHHSSFLTTFSRSQVASLVATLLDYAILFLFTEVFKIWYVIATASGAIVGAVTNFLINRHWSFQATHGNWERQARRYALASIGSLILNTGGVFLVTEYGRVHYAISVILVSVLVGLIFNYPIYRHYVYRS